MRNVTSSIGDVELEAVEALMGRAEGRLDAGRVVDPADRNLAALAVIAHQGDAGLLAVGRRHLLLGEPVVGLL